jgi:uncharacterized membrane protein
MAKPKYRNLSPSQPNPQSPLERPTEYLQITYQAPLPPPNMLAEYERIMPGISERLVLGMEKQTIHRQGLENKKIDADIASERKGQMLAFILAALAIIGSFYLIATGKDRYGIYVFITTFASLVTVFVVGKLKQSRELVRKRTEMLQLLPRQSAPPE